MLEAVTAIIQARYSSNLFPGRSMVKIAGRTVLEHIVSRIRQIEYVSEIILATTAEHEDDTLVLEAKRLDILVYRGDKQDVVARLLGAACMGNAESILKINGNHPLFDPYLAEDMIKKHLCGSFDFSYNEHVNGVLFGTGCEVINKKLLYDLNDKTLTPEQREAGTLYFHQNDLGYKLNIHPYSNPRRYFNICFDTGKDLKLIDFVINNLEQPYTGEIIDLLDKNPVLVESNKYISIQEVGIEKLYLFPEKIAALKDKNLADTDYTYPVSVELSLTNRCNFDCVWCSDKDIRVRSSGDMDFEVLKRLFDDLKQGGTKGIVIEGGGEPTLHRSFVDIVNQAYEQGFGVGLITNSSIRITNDILDKLEWIRVSLDASNREEQKLLKRSDSFERVMSNIKSACLSKATVGIGYVVTSKNIGNLESLILRLRDFGVNYIQFRPVIDHEELNTNIDLTYLNRYQNSKFSVILDGMRQNLAEGNDNLPCIVHSLTTVIASDGSVYLCGRLNIHEWFKPIGNINNQSFREIWHGKIRIKQSMMVSDPGFCKEHCPRCRLTKFNQLFDRLHKTKTKNFI